MFGLSVCPRGSTSIDSERLEMVDELAESKSECARTYFSVLISSDNGLRKETRFGQGNISRLVEKEILRESVRGMRVFDSMETK